MPEQPRNHAEEIAAALRASAAETCGPHARTLAGAASLMTTPRKPEAVPDLNFAKSVFCTHFERLSMVLCHTLDREQLDEIRAAVDAIVTEAVTRYTSDLTDDDIDRLSLRLDYSQLAENVNWVGVASHVNARTVADNINLHTLAALLQPGIAREIDLTDLAAVMMPLVLPELDRIARAIADAPNPQASTPAAPDPADIVERRTIDRVMELRNALRDLLARDLAGMVANREHWHADYRAVVERAETALGIAPAEAPDPEPAPAQSEPTTIGPPVPAMRWARVIGNDGRDAAIMHCTSCGQDHERVTATQYRTAPYEWYFHCPTTGRPVVLEGFPEIPF